MAGLTQEEIFEIMSGFDELMQLEDQQLHEQGKKLYEVLSKRKADNLYEDLCRNCSFIGYKGYVDGVKSEDDIIVSGAKHFRQESDTRGFKYEYVNETIGGGYTGDEFAGTVAFEWKGKYIVFAYEC